MRRWLRLLKAMVWGTTEPPGPDVVVRRWRFTTDSRGDVEVRYWMKWGRPTTFSASVRPIIEERMERLLTREVSSSKVRSIDVQMTPPRSTTRGQTDT